MLIELESFNFRSASEQTYSNNLSLNVTSKCGMYNSLNCIPSSQVLRFSLNFTMNPTVYH